MNRIKKAIAISYLFMSLVEEVAEGVGAAEEGTRVLAVKPEKKSRFVATVNCRVCLRSHLEISAFGL